MKPMRAWPPLLATERRSERDTRERVQCVWVRMGPVRAWLRWARGGVRGGGRRGGEEARLFWPHTTSIPQHDKVRANDTTKEGRGEDTLPTRRRKIMMLYGDRGSAVPARVEEECGCALGIPTS